MKTKALCISLLLALAPATTYAQQQFKSPEAAADEMVRLVKAGNVDGFEKLLGPEYAKFHEGQEADPALAKLRRDSFIAAVKEFHSISTEGDKRTVYVGSEGWPFPVPIVKSGGKWMFDGKAGIEELQNRIVGANELNAIAALDAYAVAQRKYSLEDQDGDGVAEFAQLFASTAGKHDGLYWETDPEDGYAEMSPLGPLIAVAELAMGEHKAGTPFLGYRFRILKAQGAGGKAGAYDYVVNGHMVGGFAAVAWPASYGETGVKSFLVNQDGVVYEADLGDDTEAKAEAIAKFDPGAGWTAVDDNDLLGDSVASH